MTKSIIAATALAVLALTPIATATSAHAQQQPPTYRIPNNDPDPTPTSTPSCTDELGYLRRVHAHELAAVKDSNRVWVTPICENEDSAFRTAGNAGKLRMAIAANPAIVEALEEKVFVPDDVVGVRMIDPQTALIYVLAFHR